MSPSPESDDDRSWTRLRRYFHTADTVLVVGLVIAAGFLRLPELVDSWPGVDYPLPQISLGLLLLAAVLGLVWYMALDTEYEILRLAGKGYDPDLPSFGPLLVAVSVVIFLVLMVVSVSVAAFAAAPLALKAIESWNAWFAKTRIRRGIEDLTNRNLPSDHRKAVEAIERYYFRHPWDQVCATEMLVVAIALAFAAFGQAQPDHGTRIASTAVASLVLVAAVAGNEIACAWWRRERDHDLPRPFRA